MTKPLAKAVNNLKRDYPTLDSNQQLAFDLWDSCARERLAYLLQVSDPVFAKKHGHLVGQSSGIDLSNAFVAYKNKRQQFRQEPNITSLLDDILAQNEKLKRDASKITAESLFNAGKNVAVAAEAVYGSSKKAEEDAVKEADASKSKKDKTGG